MADIVCRRYSRFVRFRILPLEPERHYSCMGQAPIEHGIYGTLQCGYDRVHKPEIRKVFARSGCDYRYAERYLLALRGRPAVLYLAAGCHISCNHCGYLYVQAKVHAQTLSALRVRIVSTLQNR